MMRLVTARTVAFLLIVLPQAVAIGQQTPGPRFEVASIKACGAADPGFRGGGPTELSPNRIAVNCQILKGLIQQAYIANANARIDQTAVLKTPIEGGPDWISAERYSITAKTTDEVTRSMMMGPYMRTLLEERFKLTIRRLTREIPTWDLVVAKGGPKLRPFQEGSCVPPAAGPPPLPPPPPPPGQKYCANRTTFRGGNMTLEVDGATLAELSSLHLFLASGRPVTDKTGIRGRFSFRMEYTPAEQRPALNGQVDTTEPTAPSIFTALQEQLGLKLESSKGPGEYLVIDHVERPTGD